MLHGLCPPEDKRLTFGFLHGLGEILCALDIDAWFYVLNDFQYVIRPWTAVKIFFSLTFFLNALFLR
jgi:hypothetical protein